MTQTRRGLLGLVATLALAAPFPACGRSEGEVLRAVCLDPSGVCPRLAWPNAESSANTDPWLAAHHDELTEMRPRVMVLHFYNALSADEARVVAERLIGALAEGSRYHGYADPSAPVFLQYEIAKIVDLTDQPPPADWPYPSSTKVPTTGSRFDYAALYGTTFAELYGYRDPRDPARYLQLCELFEQGIVNELWLVVGDTTPSRRPNAVLERKQVYDESTSPLAGRFDICAGTSCFNVGDPIECAVSVRIAAVTPDRGPGCDLRSLGNAFQNLRFDIPALDREAMPFLNFGMRDRYLVEFDNWYEACSRSQTAPCITYPNANAATGVLDDGTVWRLEPFNQGCGSAEFPPNAQDAQDYANPDPVAARCEHFGLRDAPDGGDTFGLTDASRWARYATRFDDCGGGWQIYWRQSWPGLHNAATGSDGRPMKNWWPYLFY